MAKKKVMIIFLLGYFVLSLGLGVANYLGLSSEPSEKARALKKERIQKIYVEHRAKYDEFTEDKAKAIYKILYEPAGSVMSINLTLVMQVFNFAALLAILYLLLWGPLTKFLDERSKNIEDEISEAKAKNNEADKMLDEYKRKLVESREDMAGMIEEGKKRGIEAEKEIIDKANKEADRLQEQKSAEFRGEVEETRRALLSDVSSISTAVASKILGREISAADHETLIKNTVAEIERD